MFEVTKTFRFEAGHQLIHHDGECKDPHGHSYKLIITLRAKSLQKDGPKKNMVFDFKQISEAVKPMITTFLDHKWLNDTLKTDSPTAEFIAFWIYNHLKEKLPFLHMVTIYETETSKASYFEN